MITFSRLGRHGQLGNQLFQYAMLLGVAANTGYRVKIPWNLKGEKKRGLVELDRFRITSSHTKQIPNNEYIERTFSFDPQVFLQPDDTDFVGYFQSENYFSHIRLRILEEFRFIPPIEHFAHTYMQENKIKENAIVVHVRRGDYLEHPELFQVLESEYYENAWKHWALPNNAQCFVFSDDLMWCRNHLRLGKDMVFVKTPSHWHDLAIMTLCNAFIISASSFSWWAAWLSQQPNKVVVAPTPWFPKDGPRGRYDMSTILPDAWYRMEV